MQRWAGVDSIRRERSLDTRRCCARRDESKSPRAVGRKGAVIHSAGPGTDRGDRPPDFPSSVVSLDLAGDVWCEWVLAEDWRRPIAASCQEHICGCVPYVCSAHRPIRPQVQSWDGSHGASISTPLFRVREPNSAEEPFPNEPPQRQIGGRLSAVPVVVSHPLHR